MGMTIDEYKDIKLQQKCISKTIDTLWEMAQKYQKIEQIIKDHDNYKIPGDFLYIDKIREVIEDGNDD